jgi:MFS family permease
MTVNRFGIRGPAAIGLAIAALGLFLFGFAPVDGNFWIHVLPGMMLLGFGGGMAFNPVLLAAVSDVGPDQSGLASGAVNTAYMMGGALGLAILVAVAASGTSGAIAAGLSEREALNVGYQMAFFMSAGFAAIAAALCWLFLRAEAPPEGAMAH